MVLMGVLRLQWILLGFGLAFSDDIAGLIGGLNYAWLSGVGAEPNPDHAATIPFVALAAYQMMFAVNTPALITGAFVKRVKFKAILLFSLLWATLAYDPVAHWVWGVGAFLRNQERDLTFSGIMVITIPERRPASCGPAPHCARSAAWMIRWYARFPRLSVYAARSAVPPASRRRVPSATRHTRLRRQRWLTA
jgi:hypothetical protein